MTVEGASRTLHAMRSDYSSNQISFRLAFRPLVDAFQFHGRSTRTEVVSFWLLGLVTNAFSLSVHIAAPSTGAIAGTVLQIILSWPWIPLFVRRLHDQNRSGRWILLVALMLLIFAAEWIFASAGDGLNLSFSFATIHETRTLAWSPFLIITTFAQLGLAVASLVLWLQPGTEGINRFGPDPRRAAEPSINPAET